MKSTLIFLVALIIPLKSLSAEIGISGATEVKISKQDTSRTYEIRLPVKMENLTIEPFVSRYRTNYSNLERDGIGVSVWKLVDIKQKMYIQYGLRLGYVSQNQTGRLYPEKSDGYLIAPGFGFFYRVQDNFDVGVESKHEYRNINGYRKNNVFREIFSPSTQVVLRLFL